VHRRSPLFLSAVMALTSLAATGVPAMGAAGSDTPEAAVNAVLDAIVARHWAALGPLVCPAERDAFLQQYDLTQAFGGDGVDARPLADTMAITIDGRDVHQVSDAGDRASVHVGGTLRITVGADAEHAFVVQTLKATGQPTDDASVQSYQGFLTDALAEYADLDVEARVDRQPDGRWLLCDDLSGDTADASPDASLDPNASPEPITDPLCGLMTVDELDALSPLVFVTATPTTDGCTYDSGTDASGSFYSVIVFLQDGELSFLKEVWTDGQDVQVAGKDAWATQTATWVDLGDRVLEIHPVLLGTDGAAQVDVIKLATDIGDIVVPRLPS